MPPIIYPDLESLINRIDRCKNNFKKIIHNKSRYSMSIWAFHGIEHKHDVYRCEDCMKDFLRILNRARSEDN